MTSTPLTLEIGLEESDEYTTDTGIRVEERDDHGVRSILVVGLRRWPASG